MRAWRGQRREQHHLLCKRTRLPSRVSPAPHWNRQDGFRWHVVRCNLSRQRELNIGAPVAVPMDMIETSIDLHARANTKQCFSLQTEARRLLMEKATLMAALQKSQARSEANLELAAKLEHAIGACRKVGVYSLMWQPCSAALQPVLQL